MKVALLGTSIAQAHAAGFRTHPEVEVIVYGHTAEKAEQMGNRFGYPFTADLDSVFADPDIDLIDICLPTRMHADLVLRALDAGKHVLTELPLAPNMTDARAVAEAAANTDRQVFVDMFNRFVPQSRLLVDTVRGGSHGRLRQLSVEMNTALLWPGASIGLRQIPLDSMLGDIDTIVRALGVPDGVSVATTEKDAESAAVDVHLDYPGALVRCSTSSMLPMSYGAQGGYRAVFDDGTLECAFTMGFDGKPASVVSAYTAGGAQRLDIPAADQYSAMIDHVLDCLNGEAANMIGPQTVLDSLDVTLRIDRAVNG
ncbi:Gfo/Idh/MocA family protein [Nocardia mexicana]|uniref:Putative dehydrogenase n=1 Tax=Nocardia mexicana TaxID=279262 RepID=A0A370GHJ0_9NOCA|nr:Gfo/Idh/MocA family oxidoreductase [Nocardia mexicana]RDI42639.1 putative dehydrogenase [Nocardia mexicana]